MAYTLRVEVHPLGVVVQNEDAERELLIEGESCCGVSYAELHRAALTSHRVDIDDAQAEQCRLNKTPLPRW